MQTDWTVSANENYREYKWDRYFVRDNFVTKTIQLYYRGKELMYLGERDTVQEAKRACETHSGVHL